MKVTAAIQPPPEANNPCQEKAGVLPARFIDPPAAFVQAKTDGRLVQLLRDAAQTKDPLKILTRSAVAHYRTGPEIGNALADLAVTGREVYPAFRTAAVSDATLIAAATKHLIDVEGVRPTPDDVAIAVRATLDRAHDVAWALRGPLAQQASVREKLGWIAVSGEDDTPHRPVNVPSPPHEQYDIAVTVMPRTLSVPVTVRTRFFIASAVPEPAPAATPRASRTLPTDGVAQVPHGHRVILFLHGHSSNADEALAIIPDILEAGLAKGAKYSVISLDLPNSGYAETFAHTRAAPSNGTTYPGGLLDGEQVRTPVLDFEEDFVVAFVDALHRITPIKSRFAGVIGGSLGGNLGLRLGRRDKRDGSKTPWIDAGIVSWSPASVWDPMIRDEIKRQGPDRCRGRWDVAEGPQSRADYFAEVFDRFIDRGFMRTKQPEFWYSRSWTPCKQLRIEMARLARRETYCSHFRQWHWRLAGEQLVYSHVDRVNHFDNTTPWRWAQNTVRQLLVAGGNDNFKGSNIFDATRTLAGLMQTPGESLFLKNTGHCMHLERPHYFARQIVEFLYTALAGLVFCDDQNKVIGLWTPIALGTQGFTLWQHTPRRLYDLTVWNQFDHTVQVIAVRVTSSADLPSAPAFTVKSQRPFSIGAGQRYGMEIWYNGARSGPLTGFVEVECDDPANPISRIPLTAVVAAMPQPELRVTPGSVDLGTRPVGTTVWTDLTVENIGDGGSELARIEVSPAGPFTVHPSYPASALPGALAPGASVVLRLLFEPVVRGAFAATLTLHETSKDPRYTRTYEVALVAAATMPIVFIARGPRKWVRGLPGQPDVPVRDTELKSLDFGVAQPGRTSDASFWIRNVGDEPLTVSGVVENRKDVFGVRDLAIFPARLEPGSEMEVPCRFLAPPVPGKPFASTFRVLSDDPLRADSGDALLPGALLQLTGLSGGAHLAEPIEFERGIVEVSPSASVPFTFRSDGTGPVTVRGARLIELSPGANFSVSSAPQVPAVLPPGTQLTLMVTLTATVPGIYEADLRVVHDGNPSLNSQVRVLGRVP